MTVFAKYFFVFIALLASSVAEVTPVQKVITLLENMKANVTQDGEAEAAAYQKFACWCKDTTKTKSKSITDGKDNIDGLSSTIAEKTASKVLKGSELKSKKEEKETTEITLAAETTTYEKAKAEYEAKSADLNKAISSLKGAIKAMVKQKDAISSSFVQLGQELRQSLAASLALADALNLIAAPKQQEMGAFIQQQVDPDSPSYKYHSSDIIKVLEELNTQFVEEKSEVDKEWSKTHNGYEALKTSLEGKILALKGEISTAEGAIDTLTSEIAGARSSLISAESLMKDDKLYLKDMTSQCEITAKDWDQQSQMRADEISTLTAAIKILTQQVSPADAVNIRALLVQKTRAKQSVVKAHIAQQPAKAEATSSVARNALSLMQTQRSRAFLGLRRASDEERRKRVVAVLQQEGRQLSSPVLSALATKIATDPFAKVKGLIEKLIVRLVAESTAEATKKGYCDTEVAKATEERDYRNKDVWRLSQEAGALEVKRDELTEDLHVLTNDSIPSLKKSIEDSGTQRTTDKGNNLQTLKTAQDGLAAVTEAISILSTFYRKAGRAKVLLQRVSPIAEDMPEVTAGAYKGRRDQTSSVMSLLEVIQDDFERTIKVTTETEAQQHADHVAFLKSAKSALKGYETEEKLKSEDKATTLLKLEETMTDMATNAKLLDDALKQIEFLKPTCLDTGMTYAERKGKREEEIAALKKAVCILDTEGVESDCNSGGSGGSR